MPSINTASTFKNRDFTGSPVQDNVQEFLDLYNEIMNRLAHLNYLDDDTTFNIELNKLRKKMRRLITKYFDNSLSQMANNKQYKDISKEYREDIELIIKKLEI